MGKPVMIGVSGIRGIVGEGLSPELVVNYAAAVGTFYGSGKVMIGRDSRTSGEMVKGAVFAGLMSVGCHPVDLGVCPTPTVQLAVQNSDSVGGIVITASHNPVEWNALKLLGRDGLFLDAEEGAKVKAMVDNRQINYVPWDRVGRSGLYESAVDDHVAAVLNIPYLDINAVRNRGFKVAYDCVNGAAGTILPQLLDAMGCQSFPLNETPSGIFAHTPEPVPRNLADLCRHVRQHKADIGFAVDPDVDRLVIVDETGHCIGEEYTVTLATRFVLSKKKGSVVVNLSTTRAVEDVAGEAGVKIHRTRVGEIHVAKKMRETKSVIGGEGNGGVLLPEVHLGRDAPVAIALTLQHLLESGVTIRELWKRQPQYVITKKKVHIGDSDPDAILIKMEENHRHETLDRMDGIKINRSDSWIHIRKSNTEPIIRIMTEARTEEASNRLCDAFMEELRSLMI